MSPIPGEPLDPKPHELTTSDGRKVKIITYQGLCRVAPRSRVWQSTSQIG